MLDAQPKNMFNLVKVHCICNNQDGMAGTFLWAFVH